VVALLVANGYGLLSWIIPISADHIDGALVGCNIEGKWWSIGLQIIPIDICMVTAAIVLIPLMYIVVRTKAEIKGKYSARKRWISTVRVLLYVAYYLIAVILGTATALWNYIHDADVADGITNWVLCSISLGDNCRENNLYNLNFTFYLFQACFSACSGMVVFVCFGTSDEAVRFWKEIFGGRFSVLFDSTAFTTAVSTTTPKTTVKGSTLNAESEST